MSAWKTICTPTSTFGSRPTNRKLWSLNLWRDRSVQAMICTVDAAARTGASNNDLSKRIDSITLPAKAKCIFYIWNIWNRIRKSCFDKTTNVKAINNFLILLLATVYYNIKTIGENRQNDCALCNTRSYGKPLSVITCCCNQNHIWPLCSS